MKIINLIKKFIGTLFLLGAFLIISTWSKALWMSADKLGLIDKYGFGINAFEDGKWWTIFTGLFIPPEPWMALIIILLIIVGCGYLEYKAGTVKMLVVFILSHILSVIVTALTLAILNFLNVGWSIELAKINDVGMSNGALGALGAVSMVLPAVWRFRFRAIMIAILLLVLMYFGNIWDISHLFGFIIGILLGSWATGISQNKRPYLIISNRELIAYMVLVGVILQIVISISPARSSLVNFDPLLDFSIPTFSIIFNSLVSLIFVIGIIKGKRLAWIFILFISIINIVATLGLASSLIKVVFLLYYFILFIFLIKFRENFKVKNDPIIAQKILVNGLFVAIFIILIHTLIIFSFKNTLSINVNIYDIFLESIAQSVNLSNNDFVSNNIYVELIIKSIDIVWVFYTILLLLLLAISTKRQRSIDGKLIYDKLLRENGGNSISWMTLWDGMSYWTNSSATSALAYRLINNVAIVLCDPVGKFNPSIKALQDFEQYCDGLGWIVVYFSITEKYNSILAKYGYRSVVIGEDTVIKLDDLSFSGKEWQSVRTSINKATKLGIHTEFVKLNDLSTNIINQLHSIEESWVKDKKLPEMGFTLGTLKQAQDSEIIMGIAIDEQKRVHGMTSWMPVYKNNKIIGRTLDIMQRSLMDQTMPGVIEYLIAESILEFQSSNLQFVSLSASPLYNTNKQTNLDKLLYEVSLKLEPLYGFSSLHKFKSKFKPEYQPMYISYKNDLSLPSIAFAIGKAYLNDNSYIYSLFKSVSKK